MSFRKTDYENAVAHYTEVIRLNPNLAKAYYNRGLVHGKYGDYDPCAADSLYGKAIARVTGRHTRLMTGWGQVHRMARPGRLVTGGRRAK